MEMEKDRGKIKEMVKLEKYNANLNKEMIMKNSQILQLTYNLQREEEIMKENEYLKSVIHDLKIELLKHKKEKEMTIEDKDKLNNEYQNNLIQLEDYKAENEKLKETIDEVVHQLEAVNNEKEELKKIIEVQKEKEEKTKEQNDKKCEELNQKYELLLIEKDDLEKVNNELTKQNKNISSQLEKSNNELTTAKEIIKDNDKLKKELMEKVKGHSNKNKEISIEKMNLENVIREKETEVSQLKNEILNLNHMIKNNENINNTLTSDNDEKATLISMLSVEKEKNIAQINSLKRDNESLSIQLKNERENSFECNEKIKSLNFQIILQILWFME